MKPVVSIALAWVILLVGPLLFAQEKETSQGDSWTKKLEDRSKRGTLQDAIQRVRGDSGKWNDEPSLQHAPSIKGKPPKSSLDDWADQLEEEAVEIQPGEESWLLFKTRQLDDNDRVWIERIERRGNQITVTLNQAIWQGRYLKTFTYYNVYGVNLGKLPPGTYQAKWIIKPLEFREFEGNGRPREDQRTENWSKNEQPSDKKPTELKLSFSVTNAPS